MSDAKKPEAKKRPTPVTASVPLPALYRLFFLTIEPIAALAGAFYAHFRQHDYLAMTHAASTTTDAAGNVPIVTSVVLSQLANLYLLFTLNEALVLRTTADRRVWRTLLFGLLVADLGHLYSLRPLGGDIYWRADQWNAMGWGNVPFVYVGASMRLAFLLGVGLNGPQLVTKGKRI
ncbi:uncharacterized protein SPSK_00916 [Sporothrix schenckii 1099-18]|uniref:DUF7704 domain-containing protein n=2 Tax=Sporothrix schenckii TaxID=29908 RepID=U7PK29_SPOS1|nr:uncharacterized protein SPSK_00916 [Sporothrix schenckii 1099-18]ERS95902.1 hypothetical protein HMPREF1624_07436 [Sporothrix schenckii ATCC 58251]KJR81869.1 hypothetical protein SPSK_00916 [Sporothrix schenckii 1099-18]